MNHLLNYLIEASIILIIGYGVYYLLLRNLSFHMLNRFSLLFIVVAALVIPFLQFDIAGSGYAVVGQLTIPRDYMPAIIEEPVSDASIKPISKMSGS